MKLLTKTSISVLAATMLIFLLGGAGMFIGMKSTIRQEAERDLLHESVFLGDLLDQSPQMLSFKNENFMITPVEGRTSVNPEPRFQDINLPSGLENSEKAYMVIDFEKEIEGKIYSIRLFHPLSNDDQLLKRFMLFWAMISICLVLMVMGVIMVISKNLWKPFYASLGKLEDFNVKDKVPQFPRENTQEFDQLNSILGRLTQQASSDYSSLKRFFEDSSHELQTPIAIIQSKLNRLIQSESLGSEDRKLVQGMEDALRRVSLTARDLTMIGKIENRQFGDGEAQNLEEMLKSQILEVQELTQLKGIDMKSDYAGPFTVQLPESLAESLIGNLLSNAIHHNHVGGQVIVSSTANEISIGNSATEGALKVPEIFNRYVKSPQKGNSGLGLAIAKRICDTYGLELKYDFREEMHFFSIIKQ